MKDLDPRFRAPSSAARPRGGRLIEGFSPKLGRRVQLFDHAAFATWIDLEADPEVVAFCERPALSGLEAPDASIDFWVRRGDGEEFVSVVGAGVTSEPPQRLDGLTVRRLTDADRAARRVWVTNWQRMLPVVNATRGLLSASLLKSVQSCVREPLPLARIEREASRGDVVLARGAVFELLRTGLLAAPALRTEPLSLHSLVEPLR